MSGEDPGGLPNISARHSPLHREAGFRGAPSYTPRGSGINNGQSKGELLGPKTEEIDKASVAAAFCIVVTFNIFA